MLKAVFEKIWIVDDQVVGADLTTAFIEVLTERHSSICKRV